MARGGLEKNGCIGGAGWLGEEQLRRRLRMAWRRTGAKEKWDGLEKDGCKGGAGWLREGQLHRRSRMARERTVA